MPSLGGPEIHDFLQKRNGTGGVTTEVFEKKVMKKRVCKEDLSFEPIGGAMPEAVSVVGTSRGMTLNLGDYQSARIDVWRSQPCKAGDEETVYKSIEDWVNKEVRAQVIAVRDDVPVEKARELVKKEKS